MRRQPWSPAHRTARGSALVFALCIMLLLALLGSLLIRIAGADRMDAGVTARRDRALLCAEAGLQYARRFFGSRYETTDGWNTYLATPALGYRFIPGTDSSAADAVKPLETRGASDGVTLDPGADLDGDGQPDFWVSIRDDDDERPVGIASDDPRRDNNETVIVRSECTHTSWTETVGGQAAPVVLEAVLTHVQGSSGYGTAARTSNAPDLVGGR
jgi:hypothetical protein